MPSSYTPRHVTPAALRDALDRLDALFSGPERWTKGQFARSADGLPCPFDSPKAACWCIEGGILWVCGGGANPLAREMAALLACHLAGWQDAPERAFADIKRLIAAARVGVGA